MPIAAPDSVLFRNTELDLLSAFINKDAELSCPNVIVQGYKSVGKTHTVLHHLQSIGVKMTVINCDEFITQKIMLQKCLLGIRTDSGVDLSAYQQKFMYKGLEAARISLLCETFSNFLMALEQFIEETGYNDHHVLVLDRFDQCIHPTEDIFRSFLLFREYSLIRNISIIYITSHEDPREVTTRMVPHVYFPPYTQDQVVKIVAVNLPSEVQDGVVNSTFWESFSKLVVDMYFDYLGTDLSLLENVCNRLWPKFVEPVVRGAYQSHEFLKIYRELRDELLLGDVVTSSTVKDLVTGKDEVETTTSELSDLPYHLKFILIASYLASYVEPRNDTLLFSSMRALKKKRERKGASLVTKNEVDTRLLSGAYFDLERLKAILSVIYRNESSSLSRDNKEFFNFYQHLTEREIAKKENEFNTFTLNKSVDLNIQLSTLNTLGLISRTYAMDILSPKIRWKCNISWDVVYSMAEDMQFPIFNYLVDK